MSLLDANQRHALAQLQDLTNGGDDEVAISVLDSVGWDVQVCLSPLSYL
jgi:FAS-associated factor 2